MDPKLWTQKYVPQKMWTEKNLAPNNNPRKYVPKNIDQEMSPKMWPQKYGPKNMDSKFLKM